MSQLNFVIASIAGLLQLGVACYAYRLTRLFGVTRVGWSLFSAFTLLAITHLVEGARLMAIGAQFGLRIEFVYLLISSLLLVGLTHVEMLLNERRRAEQQARKMESIGQLTEGVAHDFNNILTVIRGYIHLLAARQHDPETTEQLNQISAAVSRAASLTRQLLSFGKRQATQTELLDLNEVIRNLSQMLRRLIGENIVLKNVLDLNLPPVLGNIGMIEQVVVNLAVNARDAMPEGGTLTISTAAATVDEAQVARQHGARAGEFVCVCVRDTGIGMTQKVLDRIFEPFFTTKDAGKGTGLGLATVQRIVKEHSGWVAVQSQVGVGTEFKVYFPTAPHSVVQARNAPVLTPATVGRGTILLVEDEEPVRRLVAGVLKRGGYEVVEADCGVTALEIWKDKAAQIDLLVTDMRMPGGISGRELADYLLKFKPGLKVIYTSGFNHDELGWDVKPAAGVKFVSKPYTASQLLQAIRDCLTVRPESGATLKSSERKTGHEETDSHSPS